MTKLDRTWKNCLRQWKWIAKVYDGTVVGVYLLKKEWLRKNGFTRPINSACFFCDYEDAYLEGCGACPGKAVNKRFHCQNITYRYDTNPKAFYGKLLFLDKKRKEQK